MNEQERIADRYCQVAGVLDERGWRAVAAAEALAYGWGRAYAFSACAAGE